MNELSPSVIELLRCPVTHSELSRLDEAAIEKVNDQIRRDAMVDRKGRRVSEEFSAGLINSDNSLAYSVRGGIIQLIADEAVVLNGLF
ncbi:hypothetical protein [Mariniblastus fucicola]|uniref:Trm112p-like protein n=1 Tax=Mariniblastus fucicola TaxID=980251 RepID=A0A5B9PHB9_9BACT|nr:hypothetical protein [Mariniblastus fucicola]QEG24655.1 hypothetical protein MFFC18_45760 [Mariniblastus fucicola]